MRVSSKTFTRIPSGDEWTRFRKYASWMRVLGHYNNASIISDDVFQQLPFMFLDGLVCPGLQHLTWTSSCGWERVQHFFSPRLVSALFRQRQRHQHVTTSLTIASVIPLLPTTYMEALRLDGDIAPSASMQSVLSEVIQRLNICFKRLSINSPLSNAAWAHLASLPKLKSLWISGTPSAEISRSVPHKLTFPALECMRVVVNNAHQHWPLLFPLLESSPLQQITVVVDPGIQYNDIPSQVTLAMLEAKLQQSVNTLIFAGFDSASLIFISHLGPFSSLRVLECDTRCRQSGQCIFPLTDTDIERLASELPQLVTLWLGHECKHSPHRTTIRSMISLSAHCLSLEILDFPCDLTNICEDAKMESGELDPRLEVESSCALRFLAFHWVTMPPPEDVEAVGIVASALRHLFPQLESILK